MHRRSLVIAATLLAAALSGCAVTRSEVKLGTEPVVAQAADASRKPIAIGNVVDARRFEASSREPSVPSLGSEGGGDAIKARAIARKRNTYGMALGDVLLEPGESVAGLVKRQLGAALSEAGYRVVDAGTPGVPVVDVTIAEFWSWLTPGFFAVTVSTIVATELATRAPGASMSVRVSNNESALAVTDGTWVEAIDKTMARWRAEIVSRKAALP